MLIFVKTHTGIFFTENSLWHEQRRFALRYLRDYGFGRRFDALEKEIQIQIAQFIDILKSGPKYPHEKVFHTQVKEMCFWKVIYFFFIQKYVNGSKILMPYAISPIFGNCLIPTFLNDTIARENMDELYRWIQSFSNSFFVFYFLFIPKTNLNNNPLETEPWKMHLHFNAIQISMENCTV